MKLWYFHPDLNLNERFIITIAATDDPAVWDITHIDAPDRLTPNHVAARVTFNEDGESVSDILGLPAGLHMDDIIDDRSN
jgi:hypothetical protein